jgi:hypothetical protein
LSAVGSLALGFGSLIQVFGFLLSPLGLITAGLLLIAALTFGPSIIEWFKNLTGATDGVKTSIDKVATSENIFQTIFDKIKEFDLEKFLEKGGELADKILLGIYNNISEISGIFQQLITAVLTWIGNNSDKLAAIGIAIAGGIIRGITQGMVNIGWSLGSGLSGQGFITEGAPAIFDPNADYSGKYSARNGESNSSSVVINNNFTGFTHEALVREVENANSSLVQEIRRQNK